MTGFNASLIIDTIVMNYGRNIFIKAKLQYMSLNIVEFFTYNSFQQWWGGMREGLLCVCIMLLCVCTVLLCVCAQCCCVCVHSADVCVHVAVVPVHVAVVCVHSTVVHLHSAVVHVHSTIVRLHCACLRVRGAAVLRRAVWVWSLSPVVRWCIPDMASYKGRTICARPSLQSAILSCGFHNSVASALRGLGGAVATPRIASTPPWHPQEISGLYL